MGKTQLLNSPSPVVYKCVYVVCACTSIYMVMHMYACRGQSSHLYSLDDSQSFYFISSFIRSGDPNSSRLAG